MGDESPAQRKSGLRDVKLQREGRHPLIPSPSPEGRRGISSLPSQLGRGAGVRMDAKEKNSLNAKARRTRRNNKKTKEAKTAPSGLLATRQWGIPEK